LILEKRITIAKFLMDRGSDNIVSNRLANGALYMLQITTMIKAIFRMAEFRGMLESSN
jgi:hypothetical protein